ncbi:FAD-dependent oxidoreductase [Nocardia yamanashiensis]|uniref:NAD(P)/FAD-dependent oxidoreductase n=1 Tax=Nocardia yamanashiensis TaxID=209247 RepID=UPI001E3EC85C|nr:FAD-dependent oxidoreductase [Nocardia yamanashiensis]UGT39038.1 FAD-dependent oxidoreductase [Nocardia yamanashiensis]
MSLELHVVVLGAGYSGLACATRLARRLRAYDKVAITVVGPSPRFTERLRLHAQAAGHASADLPIEELLDGTGIEFVCGTATNIDTETRRVTVETLGQVRGIEYDTLVYAIGSVTDTAIVPGADQHAYTLNSPQEAARVARKLAELPDGSQVTVCGGGLTGIEAATEFAEAYPALRVSLVSSGEPGAMMGPRARAHMHRAFGRLRVTVRSGRVTKVLPDAVEIGGTGLLPSDLTLWTTGVRVAALAAEAGIGTDAAGVVTVDPTLRSITHPDIYAVGDAAAIRQPWGAVHGTCQSGIPAGAHAADSIARELHGGVPKPFRFGYFHQPVSLGRHDAVIQFTHHDDSPGRFVLTGKWAVRYKEWVSSTPPVTFVKMKGLFGLLRPTGMSKGGRATRKPYRD